MTNMLELATGAAEYGPMAPLPSSGRLSRLRHGRPLIPRVFQGFPLAYEKMAA